MTPNDQINSQTSSISTEIAETPNFPMEANTPNPVRKTRSRTGCLNCRRKRRKCDGERQPGCLRCRQRNETCEWGVRLSFRADNAMVLDSGHPSMLQEGPRITPQNFRIMNITSQVEKQCQRQIYEDVDIFTGCSPSGSQPQTRIFKGDSPPQQSPTSMDTANSVEFESPMSMNLDSEASGSTPRISFNSNRDVLTPQSLVDVANNFQEVQVSSRHDEDAAAELLALRYIDQPSQARTPPAPHPFVHPSEITSSVPHFEIIETRLPTGDDLPGGSDILFLPGSVNHELHSTLRDHLLCTYRSNAGTRCTTPELQHPEIRPNITAEREYILWTNWINEVAPWLDKFDNGRHFEHRIPFLARSAPYLKNSLLALSARQLERKQKSASSSESLGLYQEAIHLLLPELHSKSPAVIGSCVILCVLEMMSCSPKEWRRHLEGCAKLLEIAGINGFAGGLEEALFWCFARMDVCGALISEDLTLIPATHFASTGDLKEDIRLFRDPTKSFDTYANYAVFLGATCVCYLHDYNNRTMNENDFADKWTELYHLLDDWEKARPDEMKPILTIPAEEREEKSPFPTVLYGNGPAVSGNQLYHTAMLLMLQKKPRNLKTDRKQKSIFWHARQICAISESNTHHGAWTNSIQPIWIAGKVMSHHSEHRAILDIYERIERETGWVTSWRRDDLKRWWGDFDE